MENFIVYNPTRICFGKDVLNQLARYAEPYGNRILLMYGKRSLKKNGVYQKIIRQLKRIGAEITEFSGIKPNPVVDDVQKAAALGREKRVELIIAAGGGSVLDSAKLTALSIPGNHDPWKVLKGDEKTDKAVPLFTILTLAATGSEMNPFAVLQNHRTHEKIGRGNSLAFPKVSFLDPTFTFTVPPDQTAYGIVDIISHALEAFFAHGDAPLSDRFVEALIKETMVNAHKVLKQPNDYDVRANIMWSSTCALNGTAYYGRTSSGDWGVHDIGHTLSYLYDLAHGATLSIAYPAWLKLMSDRIPERIEKLGKYLYNLKSVEKTIENLEIFFRSIKSPVKLSEAGIGPDKKDEIVQLMTKNKISGMNYKFSEEDYRKLAELMM